ncbi:hypothetical protein [Pandoraea apista]|nr:hypothetical protein [Pandoraea apista]
MTMSHFIFVTIEPHTTKAAHARPAGFDGKSGRTVFINAMRVS